MPRGLDFALHNANFTIKLILRNWKLLDSDVVSSGIKEPAKKKMTKHLPREQLLHRNALQSAHHLQGLFLACVRNRCLVGAPLGF